jgi:hypothetical protein
MSSRERPTIRDSASQRNSADWIKPWRSMRFATRHPASRAADLRHFRRSRYGLHGVGGRRCASGRCARSGWVAGAGNGVTVGSTRARMGKPRIQIRPRPHGLPRQPSTLPGCLLFENKVKGTRPTDPGMPGPSSRGENGPGRENAQRRLRRRDCRPSRPTIPLASMVSGPGSGTKVSSNA